mgnify:CR=1 FL=1
MECHVANPKLPFYASLPLAGDLVKEDIRLGYRSFDIAPMVAAIEAGGKVSEVDLAKVEKVIQDGTMPMAKYYLVHWGSSLIDSEKTLALDWIRTHVHRLIQTAWLLPILPTRRFVRWKIQWQ